MLEEILSIPTFTGREELLSDYVMAFALENDLRLQVDGKRNLYLTKGTPKDGEYYPCVVAHLDTVHIDQEEMVRTNRRIYLTESITDGKRALKGMDLVRNVPTGIGGDNKCGVYIALKLMMEFDVIKAAFFVEEETGMQGSKKADDEFFRDVGYALQFDAPTRNWFSSMLMAVPLWDEVFFADILPVLHRFGITNITSNDPFTDVLQIRKKYNICCAVFPTGYYNQHSKDEYVIPEETEECVLIGIDAIKTLGKKRYSLV